MKKTVILIVVATLVIWGVYAMVGKQAGSNTFKVGFIAPLSGDAAGYGEPMRNIVQIALYEINTDGGVNGKKLEVIYEDDKCSGKDAANAVQKLVNVDKVQVIIGSACSGATLAAVPVAESAKIVLFSPAASSPDLQENKRNKRPPQNSYYGRGTQYKIFA